MTAVQAFVGIDAGTTGCTVMIFDEHGVRLGHGYHEYPVSSPRAGWVEQDVEDVWRGICSASKQAVAAAGSVPSAVGEMATPILKIAPWLVIAMLLFMPWSYVNSRRKQRVREVEQDMPVTLELLATMSESGLAFDSALERVVEAHRQDRPVFRELRTFQLEVLSGVSRVLCFRRRFPMTSERNAGEWDATPRSARVGNGCRVHADRDAQWRIPEQLVVPPRDIVQDLPIPQRVALTREQVVRRRLQHIRGIAAGNERLARGGWIRGERVLVKDEARARQPGLGRYNERRTAGNPVGHHKR